MPARQYVLAFPYELSGFSATKPEVLTALSRITGANPRGNEGKLAAAHGGTLFLDEVAEMSAPAQAMLLRFLEDGSYHRVGESTPRYADVRLLCATCRDLPELVASGATRKDLFYRINGGTVRLPMLRERTDRLEVARALLDRLVAMPTRMPTR